MPKARFFSRFQIGLHWLIALLVLFQYLASDPIEALWQGRVSGALPNVPVPDHHVAFGFVIFALMLLRFWLILRTGFPPLPKRTSHEVKLFVRTLDVLFYAVLFALPLSGAAAWYFGVVPAIGVHDLLTVLLLVIVALHAAGALVQQFWLHNGVLKHMFGRV